MTAERRRINLISTTAIREADPVPWPGGRRDEDAGAEERRKPRTRPGPRVSFCAARAFEALVDQTRLGPRAPGSPGHRAAGRLIRARLEACGLEVHEQRWEVTLGPAPGGRAELCNILARVPGRDRSRTTLLGTHWDTRWIADNERDVAARALPIPGANDGGSGTAVLLELARVLSDRQPEHDVVLAFFDGEDIGDLDGHPFGVGAAHFVAAPEGFLPDEAVIVDMVGGAGMHLNVEVTSLEHSPASRALFERLFAIGRARRLSPFEGGRRIRVWSDQKPFHDAGIAAALLIDLDYPWWHTHDDTVEHCSPRSLGAVGTVLEAWVRGREA